MLQIQACLLFFGQSDCLRNINLKVPQAVAADICEFLRYLRASSLRPSLLGKVMSEMLFTRQSVSQGCVRWGDPGSLFITAGAERCGALTFGRVGWEVKSNTNKVETLIVAFMDGAGTAPSPGERVCERARERAREREWHLKKKKERRRKERGALTSNVCFHSRIHFLLASGIFFFYIVF